MIFDLVKNPLNLKQVVLEGDCAAGEEAADGASDERPNGLQCCFEHSRPVDFKFHDVSFLWLVCGGWGWWVLRALQAAFGWDMCDTWDI